MLLRDALPTKEHSDYGAVGESVPAKYLLLGRIPQVDLVANAAYLRFHQRFRCDATQFGESCGKLKRLATIRQIQHNLGDTKRRPKAERDLEVI